MLMKTSTQQAPWTVIEGNDKRWARVKTLKTVVNALKSSSDGG
jgi:polyphosphate kinase 2 (PPK2 family)